MKKYVILLIAWALTCPATFASGGEKGDNVIVKIEKGDMPGKIVLRLANLEKQNTQIAVQGIDGTIWFSKYIRRKAGYSTKMDLSRLPVGDNVLYVRNGHSMCAKAFAMNGDGIAFFDQPSTDKEGSVLITHFTDRGDLSLGLQLANVQKRPVTIQITMMGYEQIFSSTIRGENGLAKSFNLTGASNGEYFVHLKSADAAVVQFFTVAGDHLLLGDMQRMSLPKEVTIPEEIVIEQ